MGCSEKRHILCSSIYKQLQLHDPLLPCIVSNFFLGFEFGIVCFNGISGLQRKLINLINGQL